MRSKEVYSEITDGYTRDKKGEKKGLILILSSLSLPRSQFWI